MVLEGRLNLKHDNDDFIMFSKGRSININNVLYTLYMEYADVYVSIVHLYTGEELFKASGSLYKDKIQPKYYTYHIDGQDLEEILWNNVGSKLSIEIKNITQ